MDDRTFRLWVALLLVAFIAYFPVVYFWKRLHLPLGFRLLFAGTAPPLFLVLMVVNLWFADHFAPQLVALADYPNTEKRVYLAMLFTTPLAVLGTWLWYRFIQLLHGLLAADSGTTTDKDFAAAVNTVRDLGATDPALLDGVAHDTNGKGRA